jgi:hypothetical protein
MVDLFKGFLVLRLLGLLVLLVVVAVVFGIVSLTHDAFGVGVGVLACALVLSAAVGSLVARHGPRRHR